MWYEKIYGSGLKNLYPSFENMELTEKAENLVRGMISQL
jgi:hypothetical protein